MDWEKTIKKDGSDATLSDISTVSNSQTNQTGDDEEVIWNEAESTTVIKKQLGFMSEILDLLGYEQEEQKDVIDFLAVSIESMALSQYFENLPSDGKLKAQILTKEANEITEKDIQDISELFADYKITPEDMTIYYTLAMKDVLTDYLQALLQAVGSKHKKQIQEILHRNLENMIGEENVPEEFKGK